MKNLLLIIVVLVLLYGSNWLFNHVNAWIGIAAGLLTIVGTFKYLTYKSNQSL